MYNKIYTIQYIYICIRLYKDIIIYIYLKILYIILYVSQKLNKNYKYE